MGLLPYHQKKKRMMREVFRFLVVSKMFITKSKTHQTHMDEKWVQAIAIRRNIKVLSSYHIDKQYHYVLHKNYLDQVMFIVVNGLIPEGNNLLGNCGRSVKVSYVPVGSIEKCT